MNLAYAAGFVDGEGSIGFARLRTSIFPRVHVTNTNLEILQDFKEARGGDINPLSQRKSGWKQGYSWRVSWGRAVNFLDQIERYLHIKAPQAHLVFAWDATRLGRGGRATPEFVEARELLVAQMHWLNAKGDARGAEPMEAVL